MKQVRRSSWLVGATPFQHHLARRPSLSTLNRQETVFGPPRHPSTYERKQCSRHPPDSACPCKASRSARKWVRHAIIPHDAECLPPECSFHLLSDDVPAAK